MIIRWASTRAASTNVFSFKSESAWSGVFVRERFTVQISRVGESNIVIEGGDAVRFHIV